MARDPTTTYSPSRLNGSVRWSVSGGPTAVVGDRRPTFSIQPSEFIIPAAALPPRGVSILHMGHSGPVQNAQCSKMTRIKMHAARKRPGSKRTVLEKGLVKTEQVAKRPGQNGAVLENARVIFEQSAKRPGPFRAKCKKPGPFSSNVAKRPGVFEHFGDRCSKPQITQIALIGSGDLRHLRNLWFRRNAGGRWSVGAATAP